MNNSDILSDLMSERGKFILIGLTGRTGSGCTTAASILAKTKPEYPNLDDMKTGGKQYFSGLDRNRYEIVKNSQI